MKEAMGGQLAYRGKCRTMNQFGCGCPLGCGVGLIIGLNLIQNIFWIVCITMNIVFRKPTFGSDSPPAAQVFNAFWCLIGLPICVAAIAGMILKQEVNLRLYLYYITASFILDFVLVAQWISQGDICENMPHSLKKHGAAWACGFITIAGVGTVFMTLILMGYFVYAVWSYCEDLKAGGAGRGLPQLVDNQERDKFRTSYDTFIGTMEDIGEAAVKPFAANKNPYPNVGGSERIHFSLTPYRGKFHEVNYPPQPKTFRY
jgi:hypothetical protein